MPLKALNNIDIFLWTAFGIHFVYTFIEAKSASLIIADWTHRSFLHIILHVRLDRFYSQPLPSPSRQKRRPYLGSPTQF
jgi:hypothetical protein